MPTSTWLSAVNADWTNGADWNGGVPNAFTDDALIAAAGSYAVGIAAGESIEADAVTLDAANATLSARGRTLSLGATLALEAGTLALAGTLQGGTVAAGGGVLAAGSGALLDESDLAPVRWWCRRNRRWTWPAGLPCGQPAAARRERST